MPRSLEDLIRLARAQNASDLHLIRGISPALRVNGEIRMTREEPLDEPALRAMVDSILRTPRMKEVLAEKCQMCVSQNWDGLGRFRISIYMRSGVPEMSIRLTEKEVRSRTDLGLPEVIDALTRLPNGLILVTGPTGTGKTTTLNYMVNLINRERRAKIVTIEDPIEYEHSNHMSLVVQQEVHTDTPSFKEALIHVLRQDPDVIVVGEMRDLDTISTALTAAETGHLVLATLHTPDSIQTIQRIFSVFPSEQQNNVMFQLANSLQAVIAQNLLPLAIGNGQVLAYEICIATAPVRKHIRDGQSHHIISEIQSGKRHHMRTMDDCLLALYQKGDISFDTAFSHARDPASFRTRVNRDPTPA